MSMTQKFQEIEKMTVAQLSRAVAIADECMEEQLRSHAIPAHGSTTRFGLCTQAGMEVARLADADPAIIEAFGWLKERGLASLQSDEQGEVIEIAAEAGAAESSADIVTVWHWDVKRYNPCSGDEAQNPFNFEIADQRKTSGQVFATLAPADGDLDDILPVTMEVNRLPGSRDDVPCLHLHFDDSNMAASFFKQGSRFIIRPETGVALRGTVLPNGESAFILE